jgi:hypothetical protein
MASPVHPHSNAIVQRRPFQMKSFYFSAPESVGMGAAGVGTGAVCAAVFESEPKGSSLMGPLVALMPGAGVLAGRFISTGAGACVGAELSEAGFTSVCAEVAVGGAGATAPTGSGA